MGAYNNLAGILKDEGFYAAAQELYEQTLTIDPQFAIGYYNLGSIRRQLGDLAGAIAAYETALQLAPEMPEIHQNLAVALLKAGLLERSQQAFERAIACTNNSRLHPTVRPYSYANNCQNWGFLREFNLSEFNLRGLEQEQSPHQLRNQPRNQHWNNR